MIIVKRTFAGRQGRGDDYWPAEALVELVENMLFARATVQELRHNRRTYRLTVAKSGLEEATYEGYMREIKPLVAVAACYYLATPHLQHAAMPEGELARLLQNRSTPDWQDHWWATPEEARLEAVSGSKTALGALLTAGRAFPVRAYLGLPVTQLLDWASEAVHMHKPLDEVLSSQIS